MRKIFALIGMAFMLVSCRTPASIPPVDTPVSPTEAPTLPPPDVPTQIAATPAPAAEFTLTSDQFANGAVIPEVFTCNGKDAIPPLVWQNPPEGTQSFVLIVDDPDAPLGTWTHWLVYDIPAGTTNLPAEVGTGGLNSWGNDGYGGPCPPFGTHRYFFRLYALDTMITFIKTPDAKELTTAMEGHVLGVAELMGVYGK